MNKIVSIAAKKAGKFNLIFLLSAVFIVINLFINQFDGFGWGDSLEFVKACQNYHDCNWNYNGRTAQLTGLLLFIYPFAQIFSPPFDFPWNMFRVISLFIFIVSPIFLYRKYCLSFLDRGKLLIPFLLLLSIFFFNVAIHFLASYHGVAGFISYALPIGILSITVLYFHWYLMKGYDSRLAVIYTLFFIFLLILNFLLSEQHMAGLPIYILSSLLIYSVFNKNNRDRYLRSGLLVILSLFVSVFLYFNSEGQIARMEALNIGEFDYQNIINFLAMPPRSILMFFYFGNRSDFFMWQITLTSLVYYVLIVFFLRRAWIISLRIDSFEKEFLSVGIVILLFLTHFSLFSTLLVSPYFPERSYILPNLVLIFLLMSILNYFKFFNALNNFLEKIIIIGGLFILVFNPPFNRLINFYAEASRQAEYRRDLYKTIAKSDEVQGQKNYILVNCPRAGEGNQFTMEPSWGMKAISRMINGRDEFLVLDQNHPANSSDRIVIDCKKKEILNSTFSENMSPYVTNEKWRYVSNFKNISDDFGNSHKVTIYGDHGATLFSYKEFEGRQAKWILPGENLKRGFFYTVIENVGSNNEMTLDIVGINSFTVWINDKYIGEGSWPSIATFNFHASDGDLLKVKVLSEEFPILIASYKTVQTN